MIDQGANPDGAPGEVRRVALVGATGRMGLLTRSLVDADPGLAVHALLDSTSPLESIAGADLVVDFTRPEVSPGVVEAAVREGIPILVGTSGWTSQQVQRLRRDSAGLPATSVCIVPNFSIGVVVLTALAAVAARFFDNAEIVEIHDISKADSPSGTAIRTAEQISGQLPRPTAPSSGPGRGEAIGSVAVHAIRQPGGPDAQTVYLAGAHESAQIGYVTTSAAAYESGLSRAMHATRPGLGIRFGLEQLIDLGLPVGADS